MSSDAVEETLVRFFSRLAPLDAGDRLLVAFSGGPDSTALLHGLARLRRRLDIRLTAAHLDHGMDRESGWRARRAARLAAQLDIPFVAEAVDATAFAGAPRGPEDWARRRRYAFLERQRQLLGARFVVTGHHRDDQAETVLLRILMGSGLEGLGGMSQLRRSLARPLLSLPREALRRSLSASGLEAVHDRSNEALERPRNLVRERLIPQLLAEEPLLIDRLCLLSDAGRAAARSVSRRLEARLTPRTDGGVASIDLVALRDLPEALRRFALSLLHRQAGLPYPPPATAQRELSRQLERQGKIGCDCGASWSWRSEGDRLALHRHETAAQRFTYTLNVPGTLDLPELGVRLSIRREEWASWMLEGRPEMAALDLPLVSGDRVVVRNRRPGDRIRPFGCSYSRRLKEVLIDRRVPRSKRDRLPLLCVGDRIAWVPGITVHDAFRLRDDSRPWVARLETR